MPIVSARTFNFGATRKSARALVLGVLTGVLLTTLFELVKNLLAGPGTLVPPIAIAEMSLMASVSSAVVICIICVPVWLLLDRTGLASCGAAALLGFMATMVVWIADNLGRTFTPFDVIESGLPYALFGAAAGIVIWRSSCAR